MRKASDPIRVRSAWSILPNRSSLALAVAVALAAGTPAQVLAKPGKEVGPPAHAAAWQRSTRWAEGRILVKPRAGLPEAEFARILGKKNGKALGRIRRMGLRTVEVPVGAEAEVARALAADPHIEFAEPDMLVPPGDLIPDDPKFASAWHLPKIQAPTAWVGSQGAGIIVAILDTGVDASHPDLAGKLVPGWNAVDGSTDSADLNGHGTSVAGTAAATTNNGIGVAGVAGAAGIMPIRVSNRSDGWAYWSDIARALSWAAANGARVANISYGVTGSSSVSSAAQQMRNQGGVVVVAAGNSGSDPGHSDDPYLISVSATNSSDGQPSWSSYGYYVDVGAPGAGILTTKRGGGYGSVSGTSFASPTTAGVVALIMAANPGLSPKDIEAILEDSAEDLGDAGWDTRYGYGRVNAALAVTAALGAGSGDPPPPADTEPPAVSISEPTGGTVAGTVPVSVTASDGVGVTRVVLYAGGDRVAEDTDAPYAFSWDSTGTLDGPASLLAEAYDAAGNMGESQVVGVTVDNVEEPPPEPGDTQPPAVSIAEPTGGTVAGTVPVNVTAIDDVGVTRVVLYAGSEAVAEDTQAPYAFNWDSTGAADGPVSLRAKAYDAAGNMGESQAVGVTVDNVPEPVDSEPPSVQITSPADGATVSGKRVRIRIGGSDDGELVRLACYVDGKLLKETSDGSMICIWRTRRESPGAHQIMATAKDAAGNESVQAITVYIPD